MTTASGVVQPLRANLEFFHVQVDPGQSASDILCQALQPGCLGTRDGSERFTARRAGDAVARLQRRLADLASTPLGPASWYGHAVLERTGGGAGATGEMLTATACSHDAHLLVMGRYGFSDLHEIILGGFT